MSSSLTRARCCTRMAEYPRGLFRLQMHSSVAGRGSPPRQLRMSPVGRDRHRCDVGAAGLRSLHNAGRLKREPTSVGAHPRPRGVMSRRGVAFTSSGIASSNERLLRHISSALRKSSSLSLDGFGGLFIRRPLQRMLLGRGAGCPIVSTSCPICRTPGCGVRSRRCSGSRAA